MATIGGMTLEELRKLIDERVERRLEALLGDLDVEDTGEPDHRTLAEVNESLDQEPVDTTAWHSIRQRTDPRRPEQVMASYVLDTTIVVQRLIRDTYTPNVQALFRGVQPSDRLIVPEFCLTECVNVLWKQVRFYGMPPAQAVQLARDLQALPLRIVSVRRLLVDALQVGLAHQLTVYDAIYLALARHVNCPLITSDQPQTRAAAAEGIMLKSVTDFTI